MSIFACIQTLTEVPRPLYPLFLEKWTLSVSPRCVASYKVGTFFICIVYYPSQLPSMVKTLHTSHNTGHIWTHHHWNALRCTVVQLPVNRLCYRNLLAHIIYARKSSIGVWDVLSVTLTIFCTFCKASLGGSHSSHKGSAVHEKAPTQRSHEPSPSAFVSSSRKSIPIPGLHARVQRESRTKVSVSFINKMFKVFAIVIRHFWYATSQKKKKRCACACMLRTCVKIYSCKYLSSQNQMRLQSKYPDKIQSHRQCHLHPLQWKRLLHPPSLDQTMQQDWVQTLLLHLMVTSSRPALQSANPRPSPLSLRVWWIHIIFFT